MWVHFGAFCYTRLGKKNAQNVGFEHFGTFWYPRYAEREGFEPSVPLRVHYLSRVARSTALAPLQGGKVS